ncbi:MAG: hypothetical protein J4F36_08110 [Nitrosopumilaceae archaeon]|nr:hypothetical protein [Nitrosopumilaceae archaeon]
MKSRILIIIGIIGFTGLLVPDASGFGISPLQSTDEHFEFIDFQANYQAGIPIQFILEKTRDSNCNSYNAKITDKDGNFIWGGGADILCDAISNPSSEILQTKIGYDENHPIIINASGAYYLEVEFYDKFTKQEFKVRQNTAGGTIDRTVYPIPNPDPLDLWNSADVIIDGTIIDIEYTNSDKDNNIPNYHIKVNKYFKGVHEIGLVFAQNDLYVSKFDVNDTGLFYLKARDTTGYSIQPHSIKTFGDCDARDLIEISPVLPNEGFPRSTPTKSESYFDPCVADYFSYDPDFFGGILNGISPLKQTKHGIPNDMIRCYGELVKITKHDGSVACVKAKTIPKLIQRDWINPDKDGITVSFSFCGADGFDSQGNLNKSNSTHHWDANYCQWNTLGSELHQEQPYYIENCDPLLHKKTLPDITIETETQWYDLQYCMWRPHYPDVSNIENCVELFDTLYDFHTSPGPSCVLQRYNEDGTLRAICEPPPFLGSMWSDENLKNSKCTENYSEWAYKTKANDDVFYVFEQMDKYQDRKLDRVLDRCEEQNPNKSIRYFENYTHSINSESCEWNIK